MSCSHRECSACDACMNGNGWDGCDDVDQCPWSGLCVECCDCSSEGHHGPDPVMLD